MLTLAVLALLTQEAPYQGELKERLAAPAKATIVSAKQAHDLEVCVADSLSALGTPTVLRDGPENIVIAAAMPSSGAFVAAVTIIRTATGSRLELRVRGKGWDERLRSRIAGCA